MEQQIRAAILDTPSQTQSPKKRGKKKHEKTFGENTGASSATAKGLDQSSAAASQQITDVVQIVRMTLNGILPNILSAVKKLLEMCRNQ